MVRLAVVGLGTIGAGIASYALERGHELLVAVDSDPAKAGRTVRDVAGLNSDVRVMPNLREVPLDDVQVAIFATSSRVAAIADDLEYVLRRGVRVVSTCEELAFPMYRSADIAVKLDGVAKQNGASVVGVGVNPGFVMDWVPAVVASASRSPSSIHVVRSVDVSRRRRQLQAKVGVGLTKAGFEQALADGKLGHVGLVESAHLLALSLGEELADQRHGVFPVVGADDYNLGVRQFVEGKAGGCTIRLDLEMTTTSADFDVVEVKGKPDLKLRFEKGVFGESATEALTVTAAERILSARTGLITVLELPLTKQ